MLISLPLVVALAAFTPAPAAGVAQPVSVAVELPAKASSEMQAWAGELRSALALRKDEFRAAKSGEKPELVVRIDSVAPGKDGKAVMNGVFLRSGQSKPFNLSYPGPVKPHAEALARNLRKLTDPMGAAPPKPPRK